ILHLVEDRRISPVSTVLPGLIDTLEGCLGLLLRPGSLAESEKDNRIVDFNHIVVIEAIELFVAPLIPPISLSQAPDPLSKHLFFPSPKNPTVALPRRDQPAF